MKMGCPTYPSQKVTPVSSTSFTNDEDAIVYDGVAEYAEVDLAILGTLHATNASRNT
jgi:hypothetical protein